MFLRGEVVYDTAIVFQGNAMLQAVKKVTDKQLKTWQEKRIVPNAVQYVEKK